MWNSVLFLRDHESDPWGPVRFVSSSAKDPNQTLVLWEETFEIQEEVSAVFTQYVAAVVKLYSTSWDRCLPSIISHAGPASAFSTSGTGYFCSSHHESLTLCPVIWINILAPVLNGRAILLALCKPTPLLSIIGPVAWTLFRCETGSWVGVPEHAVVTSRKCTMKPSTVRFWLVPRAVFWLVPYLSLLCQQVGGLESVSLWQEVDKLDPASTFFLSFFFFVCVCVSSGV